ncbi:Hypothetical predicted protein [Scomber scombrus]|uniref:Uncharacterized protein n=1 Tax=Scomber scombrus TaxID=13677 RepID=A0AAV1NST8_SCOSC
MEEELRLKTPNPKYGHCSSTQTLYDIWLGIITLGPGLSVAQWSVCGNSTVTRHDTSKVQRVPQAITNCRCAHSASVWTQQLQMTAFFILSLCRAGLV